MAVSLAYLNEILQKDYLPGFTAQLNEESSYFYKLMTKNTTPAMGADGTFLVTYGRSQGIGNRAEDGDVPTAGAAKRKQISVVPKNFYARIALSDRLIKSSSGGASFVNALDQEMNEIMRDSKDSLNRQMFGNGKGAMATLVGAASGTTATVDDAKFLAVNQRVDIVNPTNGSVSTTNLVITNVDDETNEVTFDGAATGAEGHIIVTHGAYGLEITGLGALLTPNNTIYGVDRSQNKWFNPGFKDATGLAMDDDLMELAIQRVDMKAGSQPDIIISGYQAYRALKNYLSQFQRYTETETRYAAGHRTLSYDGIPVERDKYQGDTTMDFLKMDTFELMSIGQLFDYMNMDGNVLKAVSGKAMYEAILTSYAEIACKFPGANMRITNIKTTA